jgi:putative hydrolase
VADDDFLDNGAVGELFALEAEQVTGHLERACRRVARRAFLWPEEAVQLVRFERPLTELEGIGPVLARRLHQWIANPPAKVTPAPIRSEFLTLVQARRILDRMPEWRKALSGDLHMHTTWSDGSAPIAEMARIAKERGYHYIAITDHTKGLKIANGLSELKLVEQSIEIDAVNDEFAKAEANLVVLRSAEVNLSPSGELDIEQSALSNLDLVIGSFHSALRRTDDQTDRYLAALRNRFVHILGHPQTRIYNHREGLRADWARVFAEAARLDKAVEIDGYPDRQDLKVSLLQLALKEGARVSLGTDAHHPWQLDFMDFSLAAARLAGFPKERIINFLSLEELRSWTRKVSSS